MRVEKEEIIDSRMRRTYALTEKGAERLATEAARLRSTADEAARRLGMTFPQPGGATS